MVNNSPSAPGLAKAKKTRWRRILRSKWFYALLLVLAVGSFYYYRQAQGLGSETRYVLSAVATSTVINTISGTGEVSATNQISIIPGASGDILELNISAGQKVQAGEVIARLDDSDAQSQVRQAKNSLSSAQANLAVKLAGPSEQELAVSQKSVDSAKMSYDISLKNLEYVKQSNEDSLSKAQLALDNAQRAYDNAVASSGLSSSSDTNSLDKAYSDAKGALASAQVSLRSALVSADNILEKNNYNTASHNYKPYLGVRNSQSINNADSAYEAARRSFIDLSEDYAAASTAWTNDSIKSLLSETKETAGLMQSLSTAVSNMLINSITAADFSQSTLDSYKQSASSQESSMISLSNSLQSSIQSLANAELNSSSSDLSSNNSVANAKSSLTSAQNTLKQTILDNQKSLDSANNDVAAKRNSYESAQAQLDLKTAKPREVELTSYYLQISTAEVNYQEALDNLAETEVKAPIDGIIARVNKKVGDSIRDSDAGDPLATIITEEKMAVIALNEVDVAQVAKGQKAILTFSALEDLDMTGTVVEINDIGTVSQGVVSYEVKIVLDSQDERIKPQMTVSADIIVDKSVDVLTVPNAAVKSDDNGDYYVDVLEFSGTPDSSGVSSSKEPAAVYVITGLSDDTNTEIKSGLEPGQYVVLRTVIASVSSSSSADNKTSAASLLGGSSSNRALRSSGVTSMPAGGPPGM
ncbi:MAG: HlyD family efflux transporter periplasmic adaptor subunit [Patescibacteria group bacterium]|nr:HlyD family efflux transporter periplasmic adaptor subunit [Patescibacteria group bacterium]